MISYSQKYTERSWLSVTEFNDFQQTTNTFFIKWTQFPWSFPILSSGAMNITEEYIMEPVSGI